MKGWCACLGLMLMVQAPALAAAEDDTRHVVEPGETLNGIANRAGVPRSRIIEANRLEPPYVIRAGQTLTIPREAKPAAKPAQATASARPATGPGTPAIETHVVAAGETLGGIANRVRVPRVLIAEANHLKPPYTLRAGQKLLIPRTRHHTVKAGETGFGIAYQYAVPWESIAVANGLDEGAQVKQGQKLLIPTVLTVPDPAPSATATPNPQATSSAARFAWPLAGEVRRGFRTSGEGGRHDGLDIVAPKGAAVRAAAAGTVIFAGSEDSQFGNLVVVDHGDGWHSAYGSLGRVTVKKGHKVARGERIGLVGDTSITRRTELHFELRRNGEPVDPAAELPPAR